MSHSGSELETALAEAVTAFRTGREGAGNAAFVRVVDGLVALLADPAPRLAAESIAPLIQAMAEAQQRGDQLYLADLLQYELGELLGS